MNRTKTRELAFMLIYQREIQKEVGEENLEIFYESNEIEEEDQKEYLKDILFGVSKNEEEFLDLIKRHLKENWTIDRISKVNVSVLKLVLYEMLYCDLPYKVAINEAVELAKKYSDEQAGAFINGILASIVNEKGLGEARNGNNSNNNN